MAEMSLPSGLVLLTGNQYGALSALVEQPRISTTELEDRTGLHGGVLGTLQYADLATVKSVKGRSLYSTSRAGRSCVTALRKLTPSIDDSISPRHHLPRTPSAVMLFSMFYLAEHGAADWRQAHTTHPVLATTRPESVRKAFSKLKETRLAVPEKGDRIELSEIGFQEVSFWVLLADNGTRPVSAWEASLLSAGLVQGVGQVLGLTPNTTPRQWLAAVSQHLGQE